MPRCAPRRATPRRARRWARRGAGGGSPRPTPAPAPGSRGPGEGSSSVPLDPAVDGPDDREREARVGSVGDVDGVLVVHGDPLLGDPHDVAAPAGHGVVLLDELAGELPGLP